jgi:hypothetical protein
VIVIGAFKRLADEKSCARGANLATRHSHKAGVARFIDENGGGPSAVTNSHGGSTSMSIRWTRRNGCGEQLIETRMLIRSSNAKHTNLARQRQI